MSCDLSATQTPEIQRILSQRARVLSRSLESPPQGENFEIVLFILAGERYAIETVFVREVFPLKDLTPLPCTPAWIRGIVNVRSQILAVIDLKLFFHLPAGGLSDMNKLIILQSSTGQEERTQFGILADVIVGTRMLAFDELQTEHNQLGIRSDYVRGITGERLVVLNAQSILEDEGLVVQEEVLA